MKKKKEMISPHAIVLIMVGIVVLVTLIMGFSFGWEKIVPWLDETHFKITKEECSNPRFNIRDTSCMTGCILYSNLSNHSFDESKEGECFDECHKYFSNKYFQTCKPIEVDKIYEKELVEGYENSIEWLDENCECVGVYDKDKKEDVLCGENEKYLCKAFTNRPKYFKCSKYKCGDYIVEVK